MAGDESKGDRGFKVVDRRFWAREGDEEEQRVGEPAPGPERSTAATADRIAELEQQLAEKDSMLREILATHQESLSDLESARHRIRREACKEAEQGRRSLLVEFLDVIDNLDRALEAAETSSDPQVLVSGVSMVRDLFVSKLGALGVTRLEALGTRFDPAVHEAISVVPVEDPEQDGQVVGVIREGYAIGDEVLRPAGVAVARKG